MPGSRLSWYWHRLRAMDLAEMGGHLQKKMFQFADARRERDWMAVPLKSSSLFPKLPDPGSAPASVGDGLRRDVENILAGRWRAFGHLDIQVDDPPQWHTDYLARKNLATAESAFKLNHRQLPGGADIKLIWELSRWHQLVRLAQGAYVLGDRAAGQTCVRWLEDWVTNNPPYGGWNWTSALETGMRLIQFTWVDVLLHRVWKPGDEQVSSRDEGKQSPSASEQAGFCERWQRLRFEILAPHVWFTWRYKSFGSSANNHLLGELAGLIVALVQWPALAQWGAPIETLQALWEREVLAQFAEDGGNREQALNYQLFSWELCWQVRLALRAAGQNISLTVEQRLIDAARFFWEVQATKDIWDYGDSDNAFVTPLFANEQRAVQEWRGWLERSKNESAISYWQGEPPSFVPPLGRDKPANTVSIGEWWVYPQSGIALCESGFWWLRWDLSPLGYLRTAAHGHLDALHLSIWLKRVAMVIDPGTGAYYAEPKLRAWLASSPAHNGPCPIGEEHSRRMGPFLWSGHHHPPTWKAEGQGTILGELNLPQCRLRRRVASLPKGGGWQIADSREAWGNATSAFQVLWQFAPGSWVKKLGERTFSLNRAEVSLVIEVGEEWNEVKLAESPVERSQGPGASPAPNEQSLEGIVSPAFRKTVWAPYLKLTAAGGEKPCLFRTTFLLSGTS